MELGRERILNRTEERCQVTCLRLLLCGFKYPEVREKHSVFKRPSWKDHGGLPYGPNWNVQSILKKLKQPVYQDSNYGPVAITSPFTVMNRFSAQIEFITLFNETGQRYWRDWYSHLWYSSEMEECKHDHRVDRLNYFTKFSHNSYLHVVHSWEVHGLVVKKKIRKFPGTREIEFQEYFTI